MDKLGELEIFTDVVALGGFSAAARKRALTPSGVSKLVRRLENRMGVLLFRRDTRQVVLTEEGEAIFHNAQRVLDAFSEFEFEQERLTSGRVSGVLRVLSSSSIACRLFAPHAAEFRQLHPELTVEFILNNEPLKTLDPQIDLAFYTADLESSSLIARRIFTLQHVICASPHYLQRHGTPRLPSDLANHHCLNFTAPANCRSWRFFDEDKNAVSPVEINAGMTSNNSEMLISLAREGAGIGRFSLFQVQKELDSGELVTLLEEHTPRSNQAFFVIYHSRRHPSIRIRTFLDFIEARLIEKYASPQFRDRQAIPVAMAANQ